MPEREDDRPRLEHAGAQDGGDTAEQLRRALDGERHRAAARRFFEAAPLYRIDFEEDGTVSLRKKGYSYWPDRPPADSTLWRVLSTHPDLEHAERRLRHVTSPPVYYDERGRLARTPKPDEEERAMPENPWRF